MTAVPTVTFNNGVEIPQLGFGVWQVPPDEVYDAVAAALETGYRSIDTAAMYRNEEGVGRAVAASGIAREDLFITSKLNNDAHGYDATLAAFDESARKLGLDYLDCYLIHWPLPGKDLYVESWKAFEKLHADGRIRSIGVSNFHRSHLERLFADTDVVPAMNQIELHPNLQQAELRAFDAQHGIATEAWSPLASGALLADSALTAMGDKYGKSSAQVMLRWHLQVGNVVIPKSVTPSRIRQNFDVFDFELSSDDMAAIGELDNGTRTGADPDEMQG